MILAETFVFSSYAASLLSALFWKRIFTVAISAGTVIFSEARISMFLLSLTALENCAGVETGVTLKTRTAANDKSLVMIPFLSTKDLGKTANYKTSLSIISGISTSENKLIRTQLEKPN